MSLKIVALFAAAGAWQSWQASSTAARVCWAVASAILAIRGAMLLRGDSDLPAAAARSRLEAALRKGGGRASYLLGGKVVWVVGASSGIGAQAAEVAAACGARLVLSARRVGALESVAAACREAGAPEVEVVPLDVMDFASHAGVVERVVKSMGKVDVLINNAGQSQRSLVEEAEFAVDRRLMDLNVLGPISLTKLVLPSMLQNGGGHLVVTSSAAGKVPAPCSATYAATKHAVQGFFGSLRLEMADRGIKVTMVCPGPVLTEGQANAASAVAGQVVGKPADPKKEKRMTARRCALYMIAAVLYNLDEVWVSPQPILLFMYIAQYLPGIGMWIGKRIGPKRVRAYRGGDSGYQMFSFSKILATLGLGSRTPSAPPADEAGSKAE